MNLSFNTLTVLASNPPLSRGFWMPEQASDFAASVDGVFMFITWVSIFFFVLITILAVWFAFRYRRPSNDHTPNTETATHNTPLELTWTIVPLIIVIVMFYLGMLGYVELRSPPAETYDVQVTARKWSWTFAHPNGAIQNDEVFLPAGRPVRFIMSSEDVLHSAFIPAFRVKQDVVPGRFSMIWFQTDHPGTYDLFCAEYCGTQHATMYAVVRVFAEDEFEERIEEAARWIDDIDQRELWRAGADARLIGVCLTCHTIDRTALRGPSFLETHELYTTGGQRTLADGTQVTVDRDYLVSQITTPMRMTVDGFRRGEMPPFPHLRQLELEAIIQFIEHLDRFEPDPDGRPVVREEYRVDEGEE